jgi:hypothetical protein
MLRLSLLERRYLSLFVIGSRQGHICQLSQRRLKIGSREQFGSGKPQGQRVFATLITFDRRMADSARTLGVAIAVPQCCRSPEK